MKRNFICEDEEIHENASRSFMMSKIKDLNPNLYAFWYREDFRPVSRYTPTSISAYTLSYVLNGRVGSKQKFLKGRIFKKNVWKKIKGRGTDFQDFFLKTPEN